jgi:hypothetical protein
MHATPEPSCFEVDVDIVPNAEPRTDSAIALPVAFPLDDFYARARLALPRIETIEPELMPQPYRSLLVHTNDMTPTLSAFYARLIHLRVLSRQQRDNYYFREVLLLAEGREQPVEFGAIRINLARFQPTTRRHILDERVPLGHLLRVDSVPHSSRPKAFFRLVADELMIDALQLAQPEVLYGRRNTLLDAAQRPIAEVVEILPPAREPAAGYWADPESGS